MDLERVMDKAFNLLEKNLEDRKAAAAAESERLSKIEEEREKTKRMGFSSQERIQRLINQGLIEKQELVNQGILSQQEMVNSGLRDRQELENQGALDRQGLANQGALDVQKQQDSGAFDRTRLTTQSSENIAGLNAKTKLDTDYHTVKDYGQNGQGVIGERLVNPHRQLPSPADLTADEALNNLPGSQPTNQASDTRALPSAANASAQTVAPLADRNISPGRHTTERPATRPNRTTLTAGSVPTHEATPAPEARRTMPTNPYLNDFRQQQTQPAYSQYQQPLPRELRPLTIRKRPDDERAKQPLWRSNI